MRPAPGREAAVLLVGGSSSIGRAITLRASGPGGQVLLAGRPGPGLDEAAAELRGKGRRVQLLDYDAGLEAAGVADLLERADRLAGRLAGRVATVVVAVGALGSGEPPGPDLPELFAVNLTAPALLARAALERLAAAGGGRLVVITSAAAVRPRREILGYAVAKQALDSYVRVLGRSAPPGVQCLVVRPGRVATPMTNGLPPVPLTTGPDLVAARVQAALRRGRRVVWSPAAMGPLTRLLQALPARVLPVGLR